VPELKERIDEFKAAKARQEARAQLRQEIIETRQRSAPNTPVVALAAIPRNTDTADQAAPIVASVPVEAAPAPAPASAAVTGLADALQARVAAMRLAGQGAPTVQAQGQSVPSPTADAAARSQALRSQLFQFLSQYPPAPP
jgi:hypothetical protein